MTARGILYSAVQPRREGVSEGQLFPALHTLDAILSLFTRFCDARDRVGSCF